jgi:hypothetical protein
VAPLAVGIGAYADQSPSQSTNKAASTRTATKMMVWAPMCSSKINGRRIRRSDAWQTDHAPSRTTTESPAIVKPNVGAGEPRGPTYAAITTTATPLSFVGQGAYVAEFALPLFETDR